MREIIRDGLFHWNQKMHQWERFDREQIYRGVKIISVTWHYDLLDPLKIRNHREYLVIWSDGTESVFGINKRGGNIRDLKEYIDFKLQ